MIVPGCLKSQSNEETSERRSENAHWNLVFCTCKIVGITELISLGKNVRKEKEQLKEINDVLNQ